MTSAYVLILAVLVLGGLLATLGDRLGTKVGKARLSLFGLRPRQTATVVTIITGFTIAASTLSILFATSKSLRIGVFQLDEKLKQLRDARKDLVEVIEQKQQVEAQLATAKQQQIEAQQQLDAIDMSLQEAIAKQTQTESQLKATEGELTDTQTELNRLNADFQQAQTKLNQIEAKFDRAQTQLTQASQQAQSLRQEIELLQAERQQSIEQAEQVRALIAQRDRELVEKRQELEEQKQALTRQTNQLARQKIQLDEQTQLLERQQEQIAQQGGELALQKQEMLEQQQQISEQERQIDVQKQEMARQELAIAEQQEAIARQERELALQEGHIAEQEQQIALRDREIAEQELAIADREKLLKELGTRQEFLQREVEILERDFQLLREGTVAIRRNQVLASGVVRVLKPYGAREAAKQLLEEANLAALKLIRPGTTQDSESAIAIPEAELEQLIDRIDDGQDYVVRILSAANYLLGERQVSVFADAIPNEVVFERGEVVATTSMMPSKMTREEIQESMNLLLVAANFRARRSGILSDSLQIGDGRLAAAIEFIKQLEDAGDSAVVQAIAAERTYTSGPLTVELLVLQNGETVFRTD